MSDQDTANPWATSTETTPAPAAPSKPGGSTSAYASGATSAISSATPARASDIRLEDPAPRGLRQLWVDPR